MGHTLWGNKGKDVGCVILWWADKEKRGQRKYCFNSITWQALAFSTLTTEFLQQSHYMEGIIISFYR